MKILMVCLGNICRSPMAEGILRKKATEKNLPFVIDSAGFVPFHSGDPADKRAIYTAQKYGVDISNVISRVFTYDDFEKFDRIFIMDSNNYDDVIGKSRTEADRKKVDYILNILNPGKNFEVPDPYYDGQKGFDKVFYMLDEACEKICEQYQNNEL